MVRSRRFARPPRWDESTLDTDRRRAIEAFIVERGAEGSSRYQAAFHAHLERVVTLFDITGNLLEFPTGVALTGRPDLLDVARYLGGPPISEDDLNTLAGQTVAKRKRIDAALARQAAHVIEAALDPERFPWLFETPRRSPTPAEREVALRWTAGLQAAQEVQKGRRSESSRRQEKAVAQLLTDLGFRQVPPTLIEVTGGLSPGEFCRESLVAGTKCDIPVGLRDGRLLFLECKVSNSATNSVKRLNRETAGKARSWGRSFGDRAITGVVLAGVFRLTNLLDAQNEDVTILWEHDLSPLQAFLSVAI